MLIRRLAASIVLLTMACSAPPSPAEPPAPTSPPSASVASPSAAPPTSPRKQLSLRKTTVVGAVEALGAELGRTFTIDYLARPRATCSAVDMELAAGWDEAQALLVLKATLDGTGLVIARDGAGYVVRASPERPTKESSRCSIPAETFARWLIEGVRKIDETTFEIDRASFEMYLEDLGAIWTPDSVGPPGSRAVLISLFGAGETLWGGLGLRSGDLALEIAGMALDPDHYPQSTPLLDKLRKSSEFQLALKRDGKPMRITYRFVDRLKPKN